MSSKLTSKMQKIERHNGQLARELSHVSRSPCSCLLANHRAKQVLHQSGRQKQFVHLT